MLLYNVGLSFVPAAAFYLSRQLLDDKGIYERVDEFFFEVTRVALRSLGLVS